VVAVVLGSGGLYLAQAAGGSESSVVAIDPVRILDTRDPVNVGLPGPFVSAVSQKLQVTGPVPTSSGAVLTAVPPGASAVLLNLTSVSSTTNGFVAIRPGDAVGSPSTSSLNVTAGVTVANAVTVALPTSGPNAGQIDITWDALGRPGPTTDLLIDVVGYASDARLLAIEAGLGSVVAGGTTQPNGTLRNSFGSPTVTKLSAGTYSVTVPVSGGVNPPFMLLTPEATGPTVAIVTGQQGGSGVVTFEVETYVGAALTDTAFSFLVLRR
jgi:hypothetical protein